MNRIVLAFQAIDDFFLSRPHTLVGLIGGWCAGCFVLALLIFPMPDYVFRAPLLGLAGMFVIGGLCKQIETNCSFLAAGFLALWDVAVILSRVIVILVRGR